MLSRKIKELRVNANLTQKELGEKIGVSEFTVSKYERGVNEPDIETLKKISSFFKCTVDYLIGNTDKPNLTQYVYQDEELGEIKVNLKDYPYELKPNEVKEMIETLKKYHFNVDAIIDSVKNKD